MHLIWGKLAGVSEAVLKLSGYEIQTGNSGGSRISRRGGVHPLGGAWTSDAGTFHERIGSHRGWRAPLDPPMGNNHNLLLGP